MTTYYVGSGGNNANAGTSWALRKLTLNGAEDIPVAAGDTVYVGPGTYRELLTVDVSGTGGSPITYIGDYTGQFTDGVGGVVRITGSDNDQTATRANCISITTKNYRTFQGFLMDMTTGRVVDLASSPQNIIITKCFIDGMGTGTHAIAIDGATQAALTVSNCFIIAPRGFAGIQLAHTSTLSDIAHVINNCIITGFGTTITIGFRVDRVGGVTVKNCLFQKLDTGISVNTALAAGQTITVNNCVIDSCRTGVSGTATGEITENYNDFWNCGTARANTNTGANSLAYPPLYDSRWFFELVTNTAGPSSATQVISPFDLASFSQLLNVAGTSPTTTDMRGTAVQGSQREWGALEYDSTLKIEGGGGGGSIFGGMVR